MADALTISLARLAGVLSEARDDWWIIGSAAVALHGGDPGAIADIDVIVSPRDLDALNERLPLANKPDARKAMFRSERFGRWSEPPLDVEFMAALEVLSSGVWHRVEPHTRHAVTLGEHVLYLPGKHELIAILQLFGREKDLRRSASLS